MSLCQLSHNLSDHFSRHLDGTINTDASLRRLEVALKDRIKLEKTVGEVLAEVLQAYYDDHRIWLPDLIGAVVRHPKMKDCDHFLAVPDIIKHHIAHTPNYSIVKGKGGGVSRKR